MKIVNTNMYILTKNGLTKLTISEALVVTKILTAIKSIAKNLNLVLAN